MRFLFLMIAAGILTPASAIAQEISPQGCPTCQLWASYAEDVALATVEIGPLEDGAVFLFSSSDYRIIERLQQLARSREALLRDHLDAGHPRVGLRQGHFSSGEQILIEIALSPHGFFAILRSMNPLTADVILEEASQAVRNRSWIPF